MNVWVGIFLFICIVGGVGFWLLGKQKTTKQN